MSNFLGNNVLITGVSSGIGQAAAHYFADKGFQVYGTLRSSGAKSDNPKITYLTMNVLDEASIAAGVAAIIAKHGRIDVLVNNAGAALSGAIEETTIEEAKDLFDVNFFGVAKVTRAVLPSMRAQGRGRIVNIASVLSFLPGPFTGYYCASKHALAGYTESLDHEMRDFGIRAVTINPGFVRTKIGGNSKKAQQKIRDYLETRNRVEEKVENFVQAGMDPVDVAKIIFEASTDKNPRHLYLAGREARSLFLLRQLLPSALLDGGLRKQFGLVSP